MGKDMTDLKKKLDMLIQIVGCQCGVECDIDAILSATSLKENIGFEHKIFYYMRIFYI